MTDEAKEPMRLLSSAEDPLLRDALRAGEAELGTSDQLARVAAKLGPLLGGSGGVGGTGAGGGGGVAGPSKGASSLLGSGATVKLAVSLGVGAVLVASASYVALRPPSAGVRSPASIGTLSATSNAAEAREGSAPPTAFAASNSAASATTNGDSPHEESAPASASLASPPAVSARSETPRAPSRHPPPDIPASVASPSLPADPPESEVQTLQRAQDSLRAEPARALAICDEHARRFPRGLLNEEREVIAVDALTRLGRRDEALVRARGFREAHPSSGHLGRIEVIVGEAL